MPKGTSWWASHAPLGSRPAARRPGRASAARRRTRSRGSSACGRPRRGRRAPRTAAGGARNEYAYVARSHGEPGRGRQLAPGRRGGSGAVRGRSRRAPRRSASKAGSTSRTAPPGREHARELARRAPIVVGHRVQDGDADDRRRSSRRRRAALRRSPAPARVVGPAGADERERVGRQVDADDRRRARRARRRCRPARSRRRGSGLRRVRATARAGRPTSARVLRYHQWSSSTAAIRAYSSISTRARVPPEARQRGGDAQRVDDEVGRRPGLHADAVTGGAVAATVDRRLLQALDREHLDAVDRRATRWSSVDDEAHGQRAVHRGGVGAATRAIGFHSSRSACHWRTR